MSFVRVPHRSRSLSSLNSSRAKKKKRKPQPAWDDSLSDLSQHRATKEEIEHRRSVHKSKNLDVIKQEKQEKQIARARAKKEHAQNTGNYNSTRLLREILYDQSQLQDALSHSDKVMSVVQDLFGDDPKRQAGFPNVTLAPGQDTKSRPTGPIHEPPETPSRLTVLSESVMDSQALNDMDEKDTSDSDLEEDKENLPMSFQSSLNVDRFQDFLKRQQSKGVSHPYDSTHASLLQKTGNLRRHMDMTHPTNGPQPESLDSSHADGDNSAAIATAINDTVKVKKKSRRRVEKKEKHKKEEEEKAKDALNLSTVLRGLEQQMTNYEEATGRQPSSGCHGDTSQLLSHGASGVSGYTTLLVQTIAKLIGYLKETETRWLEEKKIREQIQYQMAEQRILIDAITADLLATQDLQLQTQQDFDHYMARTQAQLDGIQQTLAGLGLQQSSGAKPLPQHSGSSGKVPLTITSSMMPTSVPLQPGPVHLPTETMEGTSNQIVSDVQSQQKTNIDSNIKTDGYPTLVDEFSSTLQNAASKAGNVDQSDQTNLSPGASKAALGTSSHFTETQTHTSAPPRLRQEPQVTDIPSVQNKVTSAEPLTSQFTSSFLEDKRHLGTRDTHIPFQPAILLSPPRQRDRSSLVRSRLASVEAYPMSQSDGTVIGTIHSVQRGAQTHVLPTSVSQSMYSFQPPAAIPVNKAAQQTLTNSTVPPTGFSSYPGPTDADLSTRIAQLSKQHEEAQSRLQQLKSLSGEEVRAEGGRRKEDFTSGVTSTRNADTLKHQPDRLLSTKGQPVSPPISPIPFDQPAARGPHHLMKEGKTIHVSLPRPDLEISATSTPSPKTADNKPRSRLSNTIHGSLQWQTPERHDTQEEQFFALTAHVST